jgi:hypothetical protein
MFGGLTTLGHADVSECRLRIFAEASVPIRDQQLPGLP